jgi:hypothetical protein
MICQHNHQKSDWRGNLALTAGGGPATVTSRQAAIDWLHGLERGQLARVVGTGGRDARAPEAPHTVREKALACTHAYSGTGSLGVVAATADLGGHKRYG